MIEHLGLWFRSDHYYIKRPKIVEHIVYNNRIFYAKFERINRPLTPLLLQQHLKGEVTVAASLLDNDNRCSYLVLEYKGKEIERFGALLAWQCRQLNLASPRLFYTRSRKKLQAFIAHDALFLSDAHRMLHAVSSTLEAKMQKSWKLLPSSNLPMHYNIITLPSIAAHNLLKEGML